MFELLEVDEQVRAAIAQGASMDRIRQIASGGPYSPLHQDALARVRAGETTLAEVARKIHPPFPQGAQP